MLIVEYQSKSYYRFLTDLTQISSNNNRFLITFNGASSDAINSTLEEMLEKVDKEIKYSNVIPNQTSASEVSQLFDDVRKNNNILVFNNSDILFDKRTAVKNSHERESDFDINNLFKCIAKHNGIVILATEKMQILSAAMSTKMNVVIRFPSI